MRILAVDDEPGALADLLRLLAAQPGVHDVLAGTNAREALALLGAETFDAVFLDVAMPGIDGLELARLLRRFAHPPAIVFVSGHEGPAVEAFEVRAVDYLVKPVSAHRLREALARVGDQPPQPEVVAVATPRGGTRLIARSTVLYAQAHGDYVRVVADEGRYLLSESLADVERRWAPHGFMRVHRAYVVNLARAVEIRSHPNRTAELVLGVDAAVPVARRQLAELRRRLRG